MCIYDYNITDDALKNIAIERECFNKIKILTEYKKKQYYYNKEGKKVNAGVGICIFHFVYTRRPADK